jgi:NADPH:quinone reductase
MRAILVQEPGGPESMRVENLPDPVPGEGEALVEVEAAGVNYIDVYHRKGSYPLPLPVRPGREGAGVVRAVGTGVTEVRPGDRVGWAGVPASYATHLVAPASRLIPIPDGVPAKTAAAVLLQGMTAHYLSHSSYPLKSGDTCLVHAAAGGVGQLLCQMAHSLDARVIGTVSTEEKAVIAREACADEVILYDERDFAAEVRRLTGGRGVQVVYDGVGKATFEKSLDSLACRGCLVLFGGSSGPVPPFDPLTLMHKGSLYLHRPQLADFTATRQDLIERGEAVLGAVARGELKVRIQAEFVLEQAPEAHRLLESRGTIGKLVLLPGVVVSEAD